MRTKFLQVLILSAFIAVSGVAFSKNRSQGQLDYLESQKDLFAEIANLKEGDIGLVRTRGTRGIQLSDGVLSGGITVLHFPSVSKFASTTHCHVASGTELVFLKQTAHDIIARNQSTEVSPQTACLHVLIPKEEFLKYKKLRDVETKRQAEALASRLAEIDRVKQAHIVWDAKPR